MKKISMLLSSLALMLGMMVANAPAAHAVWDCDSWRQWPVYGYAKCNYGLGGVRVVVDCWEPSTNATYIIRSGWVSAGRTAFATCYSNTYAVYDRYETF